MKYMDYLLHRTNILGILQNSEYLYLEYIQVY